MTKEQLDQWTEYEKVAMHFNQLLIHLRSQAVGVVAAIITATGLLAREGSSIRWGEMSVIAITLLFSWISLAVIDLGYYAKLLRGAINGILAFENTLQKSEIKFSTTIERMFHKEPSDRDKRLNLISTYSMLPSRFSSLRGA